MLAGSRGVSYDVLVSTKIVAAKMARIHIYIFTSLYFPDL